jgi:hypothetical protein
MKVTVRSDDLSEKHSLRIERMHHGNVQVTSIDADLWAEFPRRSMAPGSLRTSS